MIRAAIYTRFSTDKQSEASLADQERICRIRAAAQSWEIVAVHGDDGVSGSTPVAARAGGRALLADALAGRFDVLLLEGLDRLSRDLVESERVVRRLEHRGVRIVGVADGYDTGAAGGKLMRGMKAVFSEHLLDDIRAKTHRGLAGRVALGMHAGGLSYGYRSIEVDGGHRLEIDPERARWVVWIFEQYAGAGVSARNIAHELNRIGVASPRGGTWAVSALYGSPAKGSGVLNNLLYIGRMIWNRSQWVKDPDTGRRVRLDRPASEWQTVEAPELRIISDDLWNAARAARLAAAARWARQGGGAEDDVRRAAEVRALRRAGRRRRRPPVRMLGAERPGPVRLRRGRSAARGRRRPPAVAGA
ncbi:MAG: recombinase family protein [Tessaracoccus sp.]|nr:recombinase family protein [Tessaracoccus sp.]MBK7822965.1 recombinase family protein [Tessaracoccus sp.]